MDESYDDKVKLYDAITAHDLNRVNKLLSMGIKINTNLASDLYDTLLIHAIKEHNCEAFDALLCAGANPNKVSTAYHVSPLVFTLSQNKVHFFNQLIHYGANINLQDVSSNLRRTPLMSAAKANNFFGINMLVNVGANLDLQDSDGNTALHIALTGDFQNTHQEAFDALLAAGADVNIKNNLTTGYTPLLFAIKKNRLINVLQLLDAGADIHQADNFGLTAFDLAKEFKRQAINDLLSNYMERKTLQELTLNIDLNQKESYFQGL